MASAEVPSPEEAERPGGPGGSAPTGRGRSRALWTIGAQAVASAQTFGVSVVVTHSAPLAGIGAFAVAFTTYQLLLAVNRPLHTDPLTVGFAAADAATQRPAAAAATGGALALGLLAAALCAAVGAAFGGTVGPVLVAFAVCAPAFVVQDAWRAVFVTSGRPAHALVNDTVVLVALVPACVVAARVAPHSAAGLVGAWGAATAAGAVLGGFQAGVRPAVDAATRWWRATIHLGARMLGENAIASVTAAAGLFAIGAGAGVEELGRLRTAQVSLGAVTSVIIATMTIVVAEGTRLLAKSPQRFPVLVRLVAAGSTALTASVVAFWLLVPTGVGRALIGSGWEASRLLVVPAGAYLAAVGCNLAASGALRALRRPGAALRARLVAAPVTVLGGVLGAVYGGAGLGILGIAVGEWLCVLLTVLAYRSAWKRWRRDPGSVEAVGLAGFGSTRPGVTPARPEASPGSGRIPGL